MTNSVRQTPKFGCTTAHSEKADKRRANKAHRARQKNSDLPVDRRETSDPWLMAKDGKIYMPGATGKLCRK